ncbi:hypothetical protein MRX96_026399 [Rhipicephalus microplus]
MRLSRARYRTHSTEQQRCARGRAPDGSVAAQQPAGLRVSGRRHVTHSRLAWNGAADARALGRPGPARRLASPVALPSVAR